MESQKKILSNQKSMVTKQAFLGNIKLINLLYFYDRNRISYR